MGSKKPDANAYPLEPRLELTLTRQPENDSFTRFLSFKSHLGEWKRLAVAFRRKSDLVWESREFPDGIDTLRSLVHTGNRNFWDSMHLENRGGKTALRIGHILIEMHYDNPSGESPSGLDHGRIPIVDRGRGVKLRAGYHRISLNGDARRSRLRWAGVSTKAWLLVRRVAEDLGKSGSDGVGDDKYDRNPKYGGEVSHLCSEFASWYYYSCGVKVGGKDFRDIYKTQEMHEILREARKLYYYRNSDNTWRNLVTGSPYTPKAGDYLERRGPAGAEHSMLMLRWNGSAREAVVFNGPWPVTLRRVRVRDLEESTDQRFYVGRVSG